jgi:hypothetical protein
LEDVDAGAHDELSVSRTLTVVADGKRAHPSFDAGPVRDIERRHVSGRVAPEHRAVMRVVDRVAPDRRIERRHADADESVTPIALREGFAEQHVERTDVGACDREWSIEANAAFRRAT